MPPSDAIWRVSQILDELSSIAFIVLNCCPLLTSLYHPSFPPINHPFFIPIHNFRSISILCQLLDLILISDFFSHNSTFISGPFSSTFYLDCLLFTFHFGLLHLTLILSFVKITVSAAFYINLILPLFGNLLLLRFLFDLNFLTFNCLLYFCFWLTIFFLG